VDKNFQYWRWRVFDSGIVANTNMKYIVFTSYGYTIANLSPPPFNVNISFFVANNATILSNTTGFPLILPLSVQTVIDIQNYNFANQSNHIRLKVFGISVGLEFTLTQDDGNFQAKGDISVGVPFLHLGGYAFYNQSSKRSPVSDISVNSVPLNQTQNVYAQQQAQVAQAATNKSINTQAAAVSFAPGQSTITYATQTGVGQSSTCCNTNNPESTETLFVNPCASDNSAPGFSEVEVIVILISVGAVVIIIAVIIILYFTVPAFKWCISPYKKTRERLKGDIQKNL